MGVEISTKLARFVVETRYPEIPEEIIKFTKVLLLKTVAATLAGSTTTRARKMSNIIKARNLKGEAGVIGCGFKTSLWDSIFLNAFIAHSSELEDVLFDPGCSWDITIIPLLFPMAEYLRISGKSFLEALVASLEVHARTCSFPAEHRGITIFPGAMGPAAAGAKVLGLDVEETTSALGLAMSGPAISHTSLGTDAHFLESALQTLQGIIAAEMAKEGMSSNPDIGTYLTKLLGSDKVVNPENIVKDLGKEWLFRNMQIKKYPCCFFTHRQIDLVRELKKANKLSFEDLEKIEVHAAPGPDETCNRPEPKSFGDLQFSFQHHLGAALLDGDVNLNNVNPDTLTDSRYKEAWSKVEVIIHPDRSSQMLGAPAEVIIKMKDGRKFSGKRMYAIGSPQEPLTMEQCREIYSRYTSDILSKDQIDRTAQALLNLERLNDVMELMDVLTFRR